MRLRRLHLFSLLVFLFAFWSCATMPGTGGSQTQGTQMAKLNPLLSRQLPARQVTHKGPKLRVGIVEFREQDQLRGREAGNFGFRHSDH